MSETVTDEIQRAIDHLALNKSEIRLLADSDGLAVFNAALSHFVVSGDRVWWWEDFRFPATRVHFDDQRAFDPSRLSVRGPRLDGSSLLDNGPSNRKSTDPGGARFDQRLCRLRDSTPRGHDVVANQH